MVSRQGTARTAATVVKGPGSGTNRDHFSPLSSLHPSLSGLSPALSRVRTRGPIFMQVQTLGEGFHKAKSVPLQGVLRLGLLPPGSSGQLLLCRPRGISLAHICLWLLLPAYHEIRSSSQLLTYFFFSRGPG